MATSRGSSANRPQQSMFSWAAPLAKPLALPVYEAGYPTLAETLRWPSSRWLRFYAHDGLCGRTYPASSPPGGGRDFGCFLGGLASVGYGWAYRVLDAQYFGVAQRRSRVFVVASLGDFRRSAAVLFEPEGVRRDSPTSGEAGEAITAEAGSRVAGVAPTLTRHGGDGGNAGQDELLIAVANCLPAHTGICAPDFTNYFPEGNLVRRPTPTECERLQGFPDDYTLVPFRRKPAADGPRYRAIGNSMAVPVMRWIGERIAKVDALAAGAGP